MKHRLYFDLRLLQLLSFGAPHALMRSVEADEVRFSRLGTNVTLRHDECNRGRGPTRACVRAPSLTRMASSCAGVVRFHRVPCLQGLLVSLDRWGKWGNGWSPAPRTPTVYRNIPAISTSGAQSHHRASAPPISARCPSPQAAVETQGTEQTGSSSVGV